MSTYNEIVYSIFNTVRPAYSGTQPLSLELIQYHVDNVRAQLIRQDLNKGRSVDPSLVQSLGCITLEEVDKGCCDVPVDCYILRTNQDIPSAIELYNTPLITRVGPVDFTKRPFQFVEFQRVPFTGSNKFTKNLVKWFIKDNRIYLLIHKDNPLQWGLESIHVAGVWENPKDVALFDNCNGENCFDLNSTYPIKSWMIPILQEMVIKKFIMPQNIAPIDNSSDGKPNLEQQINN